MCDEGATLDECRFHIHGSIDRYGWFIQYVEVEPISRAWAYTIGLSAGFDHPELAVTGVHPDTAARVLNGIGDLIREGHRFPGHRLSDLRGRPITFWPVHRAHWRRGVFAVWDDYYECLGPPLPARSALEVVLPGQRTRLALPTSVIGEP